MAGASESEIEQVYRRRYAAFGRGVLPITGDWSLAADAVQEGFARALRYRESFAGGSLEAWVWRIVVRRALSQRPAPLPVSASVDAFLDPSGGELADAVRSAVEDLPERQRLVVFLRYFADLSYAEIADVCEIAEGTVAATLAKARARLEEALAGRVR
jgi:DNA-directed RNA polymerase specialized sigma24 family protein